MGLPVYHEPVDDNPYLSDFYGDMAKYSFPLQMWLLSRRFQQQQAIIWSKAGGIADRSIYEDSIFAGMLASSGLMDERDYATYREMFDHMSNFMRRPNLIVHLDVTPQESYDRIQQRSRGCESGITVEYLTALYEGYEAFIDDVSRYIPVIRVDWHTYCEPEDMAAMIRSEFSRMRSISSISHADVLAASPRAPKAAASAQAEAGEEGEDGEDGEVSGKFDRAEEETVVLVASALDE